MLYSAYVFCADTEILEFKTQSGVFTEWVSLSHHCQATVVSQTIISQRPSELTRTTAVPDQGADITSQASVRRRSHGLVGTEHGAE